MPDVGIGRGKGGEEGDADDNTAHFAVAHVIARHASAGLIAQVGVVEQRGGVSSQEPERQPMLCHPIHASALYCSRGIGLRPKAPNLGKATRIRIRARGADESMGPSAIGYPRNYAHGAL